MSQPTAYPLAWPDQQPRHKGYREKWPTGGKPMTLDAALRECQAELHRLGARNIILSSNVTLGANVPADPGVVAYATWDGMQIAIPCDRWNTVAGNLRAIAKTIEAMRGMERWGAKHMIRSMFSGLVALPAPEDWRAVLGFKPHELVSLIEAERAYRDRARRAHPDHPEGSHDKMTRLNTAMDRARKELA
jgi:hypothetical protein